MKSAPKHEVAPVSDRLPPAGERVIVVCKESGCLGYRDRHGPWRDDAQHRELQDVIGWAEVWCAGNTA